MSEIRDTQILGWGRQLRSQMKGYRLSIPDEFILRFGRLVSERTRLTPEDRDSVIEECAKVCDARFTGDLNREDQEVRRCAAAIRALKEREAGA